MEPSPTFRARAPGLAFGTAVLFTFMRAVASCILADPPSELPVLPSMGPVIDRIAVQPPPPVLLAWPTSFVVPVNVDDPPTSTTGNAPLFNYQLRVDNPYGSLTPGVANSSATSGKVVIEVSAPPPPGPPQCHVVEFIAYNVAGSDSVSWEYSPTGAAGSCASLDAGVFGDAAFPDMATMVMVPVEGGAD